ncbi:PREDICTED: uncharacterized protein LOC104701554 [Camelina sativa]|uniref:Uncharacterized protein LOC104701554 n=1 Tax=Camelina sativa TaxID=90675 RepID=A0ABM1Q923_CAMSA|nr:PREDICTED: uncharacterized protein LOC104701554 [Camelina sativa]XP_010415564.1 PREDICTED: uncharacterized protein LOC104701554 [Camelina sativa]XP_019083261.1 PREDICTED: uncharacterized protein LOC104701554 [Camelina sativa]
MDRNHKKGKNRKSYHLKKHKKSDNSSSFDPRPTNKERNDEKPVLFQLGSIASYVVSDVRLEPDPEITSRRSASLSLSPTSSGDTLETNAKERKSSLSFDSSVHNKELLSLSSKLCELQGSSDTLGSQVSGVTHASVEPTLLSPSVQMMDREGSDHAQRNSSPTLEKNLSTLSNDSLFSLSIGDNTIGRDELFSYRDFKSGEITKSGELLSFCPTVHIPAYSSDLGKSFDMEDKASGESEDKSSNSDVSWRNIGDCNNSDEAPSSTQSFSHPITKKNKTKKKATKKKATQQQQQPKQKKRCSWLCCTNTGPCFSCCRWPSCDYSLSCCKRRKCCSCFSWCGWPSCDYSSSCGWLFCCHWSCWSCCCCSSSSKKVVDDEMTTRGSEVSKKSHKWFCCFPCCSSSSSQH